MMSKDFLDNDSSIPSLKQIAIDLNLKPHELRRQIKNVYEQFFESDEYYSLDFSETKIIFDLSYFKNRGNFKIKNASHLPLIG